MGQIFISYRRVDSDFAHRLREKLASLLDDAIFIDIEIREDNFVKAIDEALERCHVLILIVTQNTFDSTLINRPKDWIHYEVKTALNLKKPIALALSENIDFPPDHTLLPTDILPVLDRQGLPFPRLFFDEAVVKFSDHLVSISNGALRRRPVAQKLSPSDCESKRKALNRKIRQIDDELLSLAEGGSQKLSKSEIADQHRKALLAERQSIVTQLHDLLSDC